MTIKERIEIFIKHQGIRRSAFEKSCGFSNGYTRNLKENPSATKIEDILSVYPELNRVWLLSGEGEMLNTDSNDEQPVALKSAGVRDRDFRMVPLINIDSVGGIHSENLVSYEEQYVMRMMPFTEAREGDVAILQSGNSMYPTIPSGAALLIREVVDWREYFGYGSIYVLLLRDGRRITKEVRRYDEDPKNYVWCVSYNPDVADEELPRSMIRGVWKVIKYIADFGW